MDVRGEGLYPQFLPHAGHGLFHTAGLEGVAEARQLEQLEIAQAAACTAQPAVVRPGLGAVPLHPVVELESAGLGQGVLNVVEGVHEDVELLHPEAALLQEGVAVVVPPGHIGPLDLPPDRPPLPGGHIRLLKHPVLVLVHRRHVGDGGQRTRQMGRAVVLRLVAEKQGHPGVSR